ncbi:23503_t:CDS:2, partial [Entrophospora sp. SA101]
MVVQKSIEYHKTVDTSLNSIKKYHSNADCESLSCALKTIVTATTNRNSGNDHILIFSPSSSLAVLNWKWINRYLLSALQSLAAKQHFGNFFIDRKTGEKYWENMPIYVRIGMHLLFFGKFKEKVVEFKAIEDLFETETKRQGKYFDSFHSVHNIPKFVKHYKIDLNELLEPDMNKYKTFNEFFYRRLKPNSRLIDSMGDDNIYTSPTDSRAKSFEGGSIAIFRLAPQDYHRFHSPIAGKIIEIKPINGKYYTVNPMAVNEELDVLTENARSLLLLESTSSITPKTKLAFIPVGALLVGSIRYTINKGDVIGKGDELGYFAYGGSTVIILWEKKVQIKFDEDLINNSINKLETLVK